jgi:hypothetical protein
MIAARYPVTGTCIVRKQRERLSDNSADWLSRAAQAGPKGGGIRGGEAGAGEAGELAFDALVKHLTHRAALLGVLQNEAAPMIVDNSPFFDLLQGSKAAEASIVVV